MKTGVIQSWAFAAGWTPEDLSDGWHHHRRYDMMLIEDCGKRIYSEAHCVTVTSGDLSTGDLEELTIAAKSPAASRDCAKLILAGIRAAYPQEEDHE